MEDLLLDSSIRNWVLIPLFAFMFIFGLLRSRMAVFLRPEAVQTLDATKESNLVKRSQLIMRNGAFLPSSAFDKRRTYLMEALSAEAKSNPMDQAANPNMMMNMMRGQFGMMLPNVGAFMAVSYLFSGFIAAKVPFPLPSMLKPMLHQGLDVQFLDASYVTSISLYVLCLTSMSGLYALILGGNNAVDDMQLMQQQQQQMAAQTGGFDGAKAFKAEIENVKIAAPKWHLRGLYAKYWADQ